jgi:hypothetical protein
MTEGEEGGKLRYVDSRRSFWDFSATHAYTQYNADNFLVHAARARGEYPHAITPANALGAYGSGAHQTGPLDCSLGGAGLRWLSTWSTHASLNVAGGINGASASCGKRVQFTGTAALYTKLTSSTDLYISGGRDLSDRVLEHSPFLNTGAVGLRHSFNRIADVRLSLNGINGVDPGTKQSYHGTFVDGSFHFRMAMGFSQEMEIRHYAVAGTPTNERTIEQLLFLRYGGHQGAPLKPPRPVLHFVRPALQNKRSLKRDYAGEVYSLPPSCFAVAS